MREVEERVGRKVRSDKRRDIKPTIPMPLRECIYRLSYISNTPVKDVAESICKLGFQSSKIMDHLATNFRRDFMNGSVMYVGQLDKPSLRNKKVEGEKARITIRFKQKEYEQINQLAYALDVTTSKATALLLDLSVRNTEFVDWYLKQFVTDKLDDRRLRELNKIMEFIKENNPYGDKITWGSFILWLFDEVKEGTGTFTQNVTHWIEKNKKE